MDNIITQIINLECFQHELIVDLLYFINCESEGILVCHPIRGGLFNGVIRKDIYKWHHSAWHLHDLLRFKNLIFNDLTDRYTKMRLHLSLEMRDSGDDAFRKQTEVKIVEITKLITRLNLVLCKMNIWNLFVEKITKTNFDPNVPY
jgi:hypothetical protein